jgi:hypothetical protein
MGSESRTKCIWQKRAFEVPFLSDETTRSVLAVARAN